MKEEEFQKVKMESPDQVKTSFSAIHYCIYNNEKVVMKDQQFGQNSPDEQLIAVLREIAILSYCNHPYIISIKGVYFNQQRLMISIILPRYYKDLYSLLFGQIAITIPNKKQICCQLIETLIYIHNAGLIHLDLKPKNIMLKSSKLNEIALLDFGISKIPKDIDKSTNVLGFTFGYCSPEIDTVNKSKVSDKSDIFSLGVYFLVLQIYINNQRILYELITGRKAWRNYSNGGIDLYNLIHSKNYNFFIENTTTGDKDLDALIFDCVKSEQSLRPNAVEVLKRIQAINF